MPNDIPQGTHIRSGMLPLKRLTLSLLEFSNMLLTNWKFFSCFWLSAFSTWQRQMWSGASATFWEGLNAHQSSLFLTHAQWLLRFSPDFELQFIWQHIPSPTPCHPQHLTMWHLHVSHCRRLLAACVDRKQDGMQCSTGWTACSEASYTMLSAWAVPHSCGVGEWHVPEHNATLTEVFVLLLARAWYSVLLSNIS